MFIFFIGIYLVFFALAIGGLVFWVIMLIDVAKRPAWQFPDARPDSQNKVVWILLVALAGWIGALIYYFMIYKKMGKSNPNLPAPPWWYQLAPPYAQQFGQPYEPYAQPYAQPYPQPYEQPYAQPYPPQQYSAQYAPQPYPAQGDPAFQPQPYLPQADQQQMPPPGELPPAGQGQIPGQDPTSPAGFQN